jgi:hypothetical protein
MITFLAALLGGRQETHAANDREEVKSFLFHGN